LINTLQNGEAAPGYSHSGRPGHHCARAARQGRDAKVADQDALNPYAPPQHVDEPVGGGLLRASFDGKLLTFNKTAMLPNVCLKCGAMPSTVRRKQAFAYAPPWVFLSFLLCSLAGAVAVVMVTKRATVQVPLCSSCDQRWRAAKWATGLALVALVSPLLLAFLEASTPNIAAIVGGLFLLAIIGLLVVMFAYVRPRTLQPKKIDKVVITLAGVDAGAARMVVAGAGTV
jgi:hypothetical protein